MSDTTTQAQIPGPDADRMAEMRRAGLTLQEIADAYGTTRVAVYQALETRLTADELKTYRAGNAPGVIPVIDLDPVPAPRPVASRRRRRVIIAAIAAVLLAGLGAGLAIALTSGSGQRGGFYNMTTLEQSVQSQIATNSSYPIGATVESCSMVSGQTAECVIGGALDGSTQGVTVLISADGQSWTQQ